MKSNRWESGNGFQLWINNPVKDPQKRMEIGIRLKHSTFAPNSNYVAVLLDKEMVRRIIADMQARLKEMEQETVN